MSDTAKPSLGKLLDYIDSKNSFLDKYGGSLIVTVITIMIFGLFISYFRVMSNVNAIRGDWINKRCDPRVIPFAGLVNAPPNQSGFDFTASNFTGCMQDILTSIVGYAFQPVYYFINIILSVYNELVVALNGVRNMFDNVRTEIDKTVKGIYSRIFNTIVPFQILTVNIKAILYKSQAALTGGIFTLLGVYDTIKSALGSTIILSAIFLTLMAAAIVLIFIIPLVGPVLAAAALVPFVKIATYTIDTILITQKSLKEDTHKKIPHAPKFCFDANTYIPLWDSEIKKICDVNIADRLKDGSYVTAIFKLSSNEQEIYKLDDIIVTGNHKIFYEDAWIAICHHPNSIKIEDYREPFLYCLNTTNKRIQINEHIFSDWDDLDDMDIVELKINCKEHLPDKFNLSHIHKYLEAGFTNDTQVDLEDGHSVNIDKVQVNDVLRFGERVLGVVKIDAKKVNGVYQYSMNNTIIKGGPNLQICDSDLGILGTLGLNGKIIENCDFLYHLLTDKKTFYLNGIRFYDYNSAIERFLQEDNLLLLKSTLF